MSYRSDERLRPAQAKLLELAVEAHRKFIAVRAGGVVTGDYKGILDKTSAGWRISLRAATIRER
jgi:hypothetical protein